MVSSPSRESEMENRFRDPATGLATGEGEPLLGLQAYPRLAEEPRHRDLRPKYSTDHCSERRPGPKWDSWCLFMRNQIVPQPLRKHVRTETFRSSFWSTTGQTIRCHIQRSVQGRGDQDPSHALAGAACQCLCRTIRSDSRDRIYSTASSSSTNATCRQCWRPTPIVTTGRDRTEESPCFRPREVRSSLPSPHFRPYRTYRLGGLNPSTTEQLLLSPLSLLGVVIGGPSLRYRHATRAFPISGTMVIASAVGHEQSAMMSASRLVPRSARKSILRRMHVFLNR